MDKQPHPVLERFAGNPIMEPRQGIGWESKAVFNPAAIYEGGKVHIVYRAIGDSDESVLGYACSNDGFHIDERLTFPIFCQQGTYCGDSLLSLPAEDHHVTYLLAKNGEAEEEKVKEVAYISGGGSFGGCEDPRLTRIGDRIYMTYVAYDGYSPPRVALTSISAVDFLARRWRWERPVLISRLGVVNKNACILPEKIGSKYVIFHRVYPDILIDFVDDLNFDGKTRWLRGDFKIKPRDDKWDSRKVGAGAPPIKTKAGWLLIYQGIGERDPGRYKIGAMLLDLKDPAKVIYRADEPILQPMERYENEGWKAGVVYPCGAVVIGGRLFVYYGGADKVTCVATVDLNDFIKKLTGARTSAAGAGISHPGTGAREPRSTVTSPSGVPVPGIEKVIDKFIQAYCVKCRRMQIMKNPRPVILKNGQPAVHEICPKCGGKMFRIGKIP